MSVLECAAGWVAVGCLYVAWILIRDDNGLGTGIGQQPRIAIRSKESKTYDKALEGQKFSMLAWDHKAGQATACWDSDPSVCGNLTDFYPQCQGILDNEVVFDNEGNQFPFDYWTPNGTLSIPLPGRKKVIDAEWIIEISESTWPQWDCRGMLKPNERPKDLKWLTKEQQDEFVKDAGLARRTLVHPLLEEHFATLTSAKSLEAQACFATKGASLIMEHMDVDALSQAETLHQAMTMMLTKGSERLPLWKRLTSAGQMSAAVAVHSTLDALVKAAEGKGEDPKRMETLGIGAIVQSVRVRMEAGEARAQDAEAMAQVFTRIFG